MHRTEVSITIKRKHQIALIEHLEILPPLTLRGN